MKQISSPVHMKTMSRPSSTSAGSFRKHTTAHPPADRKGGGKTKTEQNCSYAVAEVEGMTVPAVFQGFKRLYWPLHLHLPQWCLDLLTALRKAPSISTRSCSRPWRTICMSRLRSVTFINQLSPFSATFSPKESLGRTWISWQSYTISCNLRTENNSNDSLSLPTFREEMIVFAHIK